MSYMEYWKLKWPPFDNVPDPKMYWPQNPCLEDAISEILFAIEEGNECLAVIVGDIGTGKTLALRVLLHELDRQRYKIAFVTNPNLSLTQMLREIIGQLENKKISTRWKDHLQEEFNQILYRSANEGKRVVIFIDEANVLSTANLQNLRLLTNMQDDTQNLVTFVLAGQKELARKLERPSMENLYQRIGVYCKVQGLNTPELASAYITYRLKQAGCRQEIFTRAALESIWKHSRGVPRVINKICKLCLKAGETNQLYTIDKDIVSSLAYMFKKGYFGKGEKDVPAETAAPAEIPQEESEAIRAPELNQVVLVEENEPEKIQEEVCEDGQEIVWEELNKHIPPEVLGRLNSMESHQISRLAGQLAAKQLRESEALRNMGDPICRWERMRNQIADILLTLSRSGSRNKLEIHS